MSHATLVTGGAGFIGAHLSNELLEAGDSIRVLDALVPQVHGSSTRPPYLSRDVDLVVGDVRDRQAVRRALEGIDRVVHFAARVGVGQSMYEIAEYTSVNAAGTAVLLEELISQPVERLLVASSMSVYGEGLYVDRTGATVENARRSRDQLERGCWEVADDDGEPLTPVPTPESKPPALSSVYAMNKFDQERLCLLFGDAYKVKTTALRFFNVYGPFQSLQNPYTGALAIFASRLLNRRPPLIFEDGLQRRDFVHVRDVARACARALESDDAAEQVVNVGSGRSVTMVEVARLLARTLGTAIEPEIVSTYRVGDIRHCFADVSLATRLLGFVPEISLDDGLAELGAWLEGQVPVDSVETARDELAARGLTV